MIKNCLAILLLAALPALGATAPHAAPAASPAVIGPVSPWEASFEAFAAADRESPPPEGAVLFVGSSSIRMWSGLETQFGDEKIVLKRGFGGSQLSDCVKNLQRLVIRYRPRTVLVYAGDNDLEEGSSPQQVLQRFTAFVDGVRGALPDTRIDFISIKPSPLRAALIPEIRATNALIRDYVATVPGVAYIDVYTPMLDADGGPRGELFREDRLHLNADGYALWKTVIAPYVQQAAR